jgi:L-ascorbate metabolism protein UlaG (beta-lactamase superfamily)
MIITWLGESCFSIKAKGSEGTDVTMVIDPFDPKKSEYATPRIPSADLLLVTEDTPQHNYRAGVSGKPFVIDGPGEYETNGVLVYGLAVPGTKRTIYYGQIEGISFVHVGALAGALTDAQLETIEDVHIAMLPVGGDEALDAETASEVVSQIEPRIVIPMRYSTGAKSNKTPVDPFVRAMGMKEHDVETQLKITRKDLPEEEMRVVVLG